MPIAFKTSNISKAYRLGQIGTGTLSHDLQHWINRLRGKEDSFLPIENNPGKKNGKDKNEMVWALKNIDFEVQQGEAVGIIGSNGAGKSTLLKILSRVTTPTSGTISGKGRIAGLLEVGTGFHPELSGRENIYLNGAILGMRKKVIKRQFDEIVDFAGVERYVDTPVKRYSSGMYVRLAFAVAAHLESEILILDEVMAVGDAAFQKKCLGKMNQVSRNGRTLLFVSHNMAAIRNLCSRSILLSKGKVIYDGSTEQAINDYTEMHFGEEIAEISWNLSEAPGSDKVRIVSVRAVNKEGAPGGFFSDNEFFFIEIDFIVLQNGVLLTPNIQLFDANGTWVFSSGNWESVSTGTDTYSNKQYLKGQYKSRLRIPAFFLNEGRYSISALIHRSFSYNEVYIKEVVSFLIVDTGEMKREYQEILTGVVRPRLEWATAHTNTF